MTCLMCVVNVKLSQTILTTYHNTYIAVSLSIAIYNATMNIIIYSTFVYNYYDHQKFH